MKRLEFGFDSSQKPHGSFDGIGLGQRDGNKAVGATAGDLVGVYYINGDNYLVYKVTDAFLNDENVIGKYEMRRALVDLYKDGSGILYVDQMKTGAEERFEALLNSYFFLKKIKEGYTVDQLFNNFNIQKTNDYSFECVLRKDVPDTQALVVAIKHNVFEQKKDLINRSHMPISEMQEKIELEKERRIGR